MSGGADTVVRGPVSQFNAARVRVWIAKKEAMWMLAMWTPNALKQRWGLLDFTFCD